MNRDGTCITSHHENVTVKIGRDEYLARQWFSTCAHGTTWRQGVDLDACGPCVRANCDHAKHGVDTEQGTLL